MNSEQDVGCNRRQVGFSLLELLVAVAVGLVIMSAATLLYQKASEAAFIIGQRAEMQQNARAAINEIAFDLSQAGTGIPIGGIALPSGAGNVGLARFGCISGGTCVPFAAGNNIFMLNKMHPISPAPGKGVNRGNGTPTDAINMVYEDRRLILDSDTTNIPVTIDGTGTVIQFSANQDNVGCAGCGAIDNPATGLQVGDVLMINVPNSGIAVAMITKVNGGAIRTVEIKGGVPDYLLFNQPGAATGNVVALKTPASAPPTATFNGPISIKRLAMVTYFLQDDGNGTGTHRLMRQVNGLSPAVLAENIEDLQLLYDLYDSTNGNLFINKADANNTPSLIKKAFVQISARSRLPMRRNQYEFMTLNTAVTPRSLSFFDRYK